MPEKKQYDLTPRKCRFCTARFTPEKPQGKEASFCSDECRVSFHKGGTKEYQRLMQLLVKELTRSVHETAFHKILADKSREMRVDIDAAVSDVMAKRYSSEKLAEMFMRNSEDVLMAAIQAGIEKMATRRAAEIGETLVAVVAESKSEGGK